MRWIHPNIAVVAAAVAGLLAQPPARAQVECGWAARSSDAPVEGRVQLSVFDRARGRLIAFERVIGAPSRAWEWDGHTWELVTQVGPNSALSAMYDSVRGHTIVVAGSGTWKWDGAAWTLLGPLPGSALWPYALAFDSIRGVGVLVGGGGQRVRTFEWDGAAWSERAVVGPTRRDEFPIAYDAARQRVVLFGGSVVPNAGGVNDVWEWDGVGDWTLARSTAPPSVTQPHGRLKATLAFDETQNLMLMFGGSGSGGDLNDLWAWDGASWSRRFYVGPPPDGNTALLYDSLRQRPLLHAGDGPGTQIDLWSLGQYPASPQVLLAPAPVAVVQGGRAEFHVGATPDTEGTTYSWRRYTVVVANGGPVSGAETDTLVIDPVGPQHMGLFDAYVANECVGALSPAATLRVAPACPGDADFSGAVGFEDLNAVLSNYGVSSVAPIFGDVNVDGVVNFLDLNIVLVGFGAPC